MGKKIKICILGDSAVGKSSLIRRIVEGVFREDLNPTIGLDFKSQKRTIAEEKVTVELWDTSGSDKYRSVACNFFKNANGILLVFDLTNEKSIQNLSFWTGKLQQNLNSSVPRFLLGNKEDLEVSLSAEGQQKLKKLCTSGYSLWRVSAKQNIKVNEAFDVLVERSYLNMLKQNKERDQSSIIIGHQQQQQKRRCC